MPGLAELMAMNDAPDEAPLPDSSPVPLDQLLALNEQPDDTVGAPAPVRVIAPDGTPGTLAPEEVDHAVRLEGYTLLTPEMEQEAALQEGYGDGTGQAIAGAQGLARGLTMGASDVVQRWGAGLGSAIGSALAPDVPRATAPGIDAPLAAEQGPGWYDEAAAQQTADDIEGYRAANPDTALAAELTGAIAPAIASGGAGALGTAARLTPAGRLASLGTRLGESLTAKATTAGLGAAGRIAAAAVAAGTEAAVDNAARTVAEDVTRGDVDITAERMLDAAWDGAKWGGLLGGGLAGIGEGVGALGRMRASKVASQADDVAPAQVDAGAEQARPRAAIDAELEAAHQRLAETDAIGEPGAVQEAEDLVELLSNERDAAVARDYGMRSEQDIELALRVEAPEEAAGLWAGIRDKFRKVKDAKDLDQRFHDTIGAATRDITDKLDGVQRASQNEIAPRISRNNKPKAIKAALDQEGVVWTFDQAERVLRENEEALRAMDELRADYALGDEVARRKLGPLKSAREAIDGVQKHLTELKATAGADFREVGIAPGSRILRGDLEAIGSIFWAEDNLKSYLGQIAKKKGESVTQAEATIQRLYMRKRAALQDPRLYGRSLAEMQTVTNAIESRAIPAGRIFHNQFGRAKGLLGEHAGEHGFEELLELDPGKIKAFLKNLAESDSYKDEADFIRGLQRNMELAEAKSRYYPVSDAVKAKIAEARATVDGIVEDVRRVKVLKTQRDAAMRLAKEHEGIDKIMMAMDAVGAFVPGVHIVGKAVGTMASAAKLATSIETLGQGAVKQEKAVQSAVSATVKNFFRGVQDAAKKGTFPGVGITANQLRRAVEDAQALQDPESEQSRNLDAQLQDIAGESPELAQALEAKVMAKAEFIAAKMGPAVDDSDPFRPLPALVDPITERKVARYIDAARNPGKALYRLAHGTGSPEDIETLQALYPRMHEAYVAGVVKHVKRAKVPPTARQRQLLYWATGVPMSREQQPAYMAAVQAMYAAEPAVSQKQQGQKPMTGRAKAAPLEFSADQLMARSDSIMSSKDD